MLSYLFLLFSEDTSYNNLHLVTPAPIIAQLQCDSSRFSNYETYVVAQTIQDFPALKRRYSVIKWLEQKDKINLVFDIFNDYSFLFEGINAYSIFWEELTNLENSCF